MEEIKILPPMPGACQVCAAFHAPDQPHERDSLYYQNQFYKTYKRFPTWKDAMNHCSDAVKRDFCRKLAKRGILLEENKKKT